MNAKDITIDLPQDMKVERKGSGDATTHTFRNRRGVAEIKVYKVFPGINLIYDDIHTDRFPIGSASQEKLIEIHHCREGRVEQHYKDAFFYLMPGDLCVVLRDQHLEESVFPLNHYHGITIVIDRNKAPNCFSCFLEDVNVRPEQVARRLCGEEGCFVIRAQSNIEHIFSELYNVPESYRKGYFKVKIMELMLVLSGTNPMENGIAALALPKAQVDLAKKVAVYLTENMDRKVTVAELSKLFHISQTHLQNVFKGVYGVPVYAYVRIQKMQSAAIQLIHTERSVMEIALELGYDNASKFAAAFREITGESPAEYRKNHANT